MRPVVPPVPAFSSPARSAGYALAVAIVLAGLWLTSTHSYLLFHSITEIFIVAVALAVFMVSWSSRGYPETQPFVLLGIGYLFVAILETVHALTYQGMNVLPAGQDYATKLWVSARGLQAVVTLAFVVLVRLRRTAPTAIAALAVGALAALAVLSIFAWGIFPRCLVEGIGVTSFKKACEYVIAALLLAAAILVLGNIETIDRRERTLLAAAFVLNAAAEIVFTHYVSAYGTQNLVGHLLTLGSFVLAYEALFATKIRGRIALTHELQRSTSRLEASEAELRAANLSKDRFLSIIAHDLRNAVSGFLSLTEVLAGQFSRLEKKRIHELCVLLHDGARRSSELLESILQWANAQTGRLVAKPSTFALDELCEGIVAQHGAVARRKGIALESRVPVLSIVRADPDMVATIIRNLVANALKFTPGGGRVVVDASRDGVWQRISVADTGCGISADDTAKLFRIDVRLTTEGTEGERGSGLGLILCHELAALNRGRIEVTSEPGKGSTFALVLPAEGEADGPTRPAARGLPRRKISGRGSSSGTVSSG